MKGLFNTIGLVIGGIILFFVFFAVGATITNVTPKILLYATGINDWEYQPRGQTVVYYSDGQEMTRLGYQRIYSEDFPQFIKEAVVAGVSTNMPVLMRKGSAALYGSISKLDPKRKAAVR